MSHKPRLIGYARVSTDGQDNALQLYALRAAGCVDVFEDKTSGATTKRPGLEAALAAVATGDVLVVWRLDRLGRSLAHLVQVVNDLKRRDVGFRSLKESIDTSSASGQLMFHLMASLAEFERSLIAERTRAGLAAARKRGAMVGRRRALTPEQLELARVLIESGESHGAVARSFGCGRSTLYRSLQGTDAKQ